MIIKQTRHKDHIVITPQNPATEIKIYHSPLIQNINQDKLNRLYITFQKDKNQKRL